MGSLRIAIGCSTLCRGRGGTERVATDLAGAMAARGHAPLLLSFGDTRGLPRPAYPLHAGVRHVAVADNEGWHETISCVRDMLMAAETDVFLSLQSDRTHLFWAMSCMGSGIPFICSERNDPMIYARNIAWNASGRLAALAAADCIHELLPAYLEDVPVHLRQRVRFIPNALRPDCLACDPVGPERKTLLYLARLADQKRPALLLEAFDRICRKHPAWTLEMWGHGREEKALRKAIRSRGLEGRVQLRGLCTEPAAAFGRAQLYCLPSWYEGFPNTVLEAMAAGLPVAGFRSCRGVAGVVRHGETGLLAAEDTAASLAECLDRLMGDAGLRRALGARARADSARYAPGRVYDAWEALLQDMARLKGNTAMNAMTTMPFAAKAALSAAARREWIGWEFGAPKPWSLAWLGERLRTFSRNARRALCRKGRQHWGKVA